MGDRLAGRVDTERATGVVQPRSCSAIHDSILPPSPRLPAHRGEPTMLSPPLTSRRMSAPCVWLTGRRGAGKQTIGLAVVETLRTEGRPCALLDADALSAHLAH